MKLLELIIVCLACLSPMYYLASKVDGDEFVKSGLGAGTTALIAVLAQVYKTWKEKDE